MFNIKLYDWICMTCLSLKQSANFKNYSVLEGFLICVMLIYKYTCLCITCTYVAISCPDISSKNGKVLQKMSES